ncbi:5'-nucleotidase [uncultured Bacteroides sp.]|uniref:5'-nucleotidase n=1 Tax=uncultured Bacteroides sp. TaxID=162156 RepID=UPI002AA71D20|nr:5'-nucleotidase [uncultured Bacteroides sp.]
MKQFYLNRLSGVALVGLLLLSSCHSSYQLKKVEGSRIEISSKWDRNPDKEATAILAPYKTEVDSLMTPVVGKSAMDMEAGRPESLLSNLVADVLRNATVPYLGRPADLAVTNMGGLRSSLSAGDITFSNIYEILPFENSLCIVTMKGSNLRTLMENIAGAGGEGVSNVRLEISKDGKLLSAKVGGEPIDDNRLYEVATLDYLAEGNDKMVAFLQGEKKVCPDGATMRDLFFSYVKKQTAAGKEITSAIEGRITVK